MALLRGTTADLDGNVSFEREALLCDQLNQAMAAHNSGGLVIVQVERVVERGTLPPKLVHLPGAIVDRVSWSRVRSQAAAAAAEAAV